MEPIFVDTHAHYNLPAFDDDLDEVMQAIRAAGVGRVICPAIGYESNAQMLDRLRNYPEVSFAVGIHPKRACSSHKAKASHVQQPSMKRLRLACMSRLALIDTLTEQMASLEELAKSEPRVVAIGEAGLDYSLSPSAFERDVQAALFMLQVELSLRLRLPLVLHIRDAHDDAISVLRKYRGAVRGVVHCFSGGPDEAREYLGLGLHLGIGGRVTHEACVGLREAVASAPADRLVLETDAPYVLPAGFGSDRNDSTAIPLIAREVAKLRGEDLETVARVTTQNAEQLFFGL